MNATELRIGNLICNKEGNIVYVNTTHLTLLLYGIENEFKPIPLTEEWLVKFGFDITSLHYFKKNGIIIQSEDDYFECLLGIVVVKLQYVHKLQNLYFALTGEELKPQNIENK